MRVILTSTVTVSAGIPTTHSTPTVQRYDLDTPIYVVPLPSRALYFTRAYGHQHLHLAAFVAWHLKNSSLWQLHPQPGAGHPLLLGLHRAEVYAVEFVSTCTVPSTRTPAIHIISCSLTSVLSLVMSLGTTVRTAAWLLSGTSCGFY